MQKLHWTFLNLAIWYKTYVFAVHAKYTSKPDPGLRQYDFLKQGFLGLALPKFNFIANLISTKS